MTLRFLSLMLALSLPQGAIQAAGICFFDDFNQAPTGHVPKKLGPWKLNRTNDVQWTVKVAEDKHNAFGRSPRNQFIRFSSDLDRGPVLIAEKAIPNLGAITISFSALFQTAERPLRLYIGRGSSSGDSLSMLASFNAKDTTGAVAHRFDIIINHTTEPVSYGTDGRSAAPRSMDIWRDGVLIAEGVQSPGGLPLEEPLDTFVFRTTSSGDNKPLEAWIDWVAVFDGPIVGGDISQATATN